MGDKNYFEGILDLGKYDYDSDTSFDLDDILGVSAPEIDEEFKLMAKDISDQENAETAQQIVKPIVKQKKVINDPTPKETVKSKPRIAAKTETSQVINQPVSVENKAKVKVDSEPEIKLESEVIDLFEENLIDKTPELKIETTEEPEEIFVSKTIPAAARETVVVTNLVNATDTENQFTSFAPPDFLIQDEREEKLERIDPLSRGPDLLIIDQEAEAEEEAMQAQQKLMFFADEVTRQETINYTPFNNDSTVISDQVIQEPVKSEPTFNALENKPNFETVSKKIDNQISFEEREDMLSELKRMIGKITVKLVFMALLLLVSVYLMLGQFAMTASLLPEQIRPASQPGLYCLVSLAVSVVCILINISPLFDGLKKMFQGRLVADGFSLILGLFSVLYNVYFWLNPEKFVAISLNFDVFFVLTLLLNLIGKRMLVKHIYKNYELISENRVKTVIGGAIHNAVDNDVMIETGNGGDVLYAVYTDSVSDYIRKAFSEQDKKHKTDVFYFVLYVLMLIAGLSCWLLKLMPLEKLFVCGAALLSVSATLFSACAYTRSISKLGNNLRKCGTVISNIRSAKATVESGVLVVHDTDLISGEDIALHGMQIRDGFDPTEILVSLSALYQMTGGPLDGFFSKILDEKISVKVPEIEDIYYYDRLGYTFRANGCNMAVGNTEFMRQLKVKVPDVRRNADSQKIIYVTMGGTLAGVFGISYRLSAATTRALKIIGQEGLSVAVLTSDFNLSETLFAQATSNPDIVTLLSYETTVKCKQSFQKVLGSSANLITYDHISGISSGLLGCNLLLSSCLKHNVYKITETIFGMLCVALLFIFGNQNLEFLPIQIFVYHLIWNLPNFFRNFRIKF